MSLDAGAWFNCETEAHETWLFTLCTPVSSEISASCPPEFMARTCHTRVLELFQVKLARSFLGFRTSCFRRERAGESLFHVCALLLNTKHLYF